MMNELKAFVRESNRIEGIQREPRKHEVESHERLLTSELMLADVMTFVADIARGAKLRDQCAEADVPFFFKQWGEWAPYDRGRFSSGQIDEPIQKFGKKLAGRLLDGIQHDGVPK